MHSTNFLSSPRGTSQSYLTLVKKASAKLSDDNRKIMHSLRTQKNSSLISSSSEFTIVPSPRGSSVAIGRNEFPACGPDGQVIGVPMGYTWSYGPDGRAVAIPPGWHIRCGRDGRGIPVPPGAYLVEDTTGRLHSYDPATETPVPCSSTGQIQFSEVQSTLSHHGKVVYTIICKA